ncbi:uncharacterized protein LOC112003169 [Quercus suber]|uniref:uncharacterized protein LOC112003169 n=1 Tax=Quercus suber TaxID=58331 RepID=UPI0032DF7E64
MTNAWLFIEDSNSKPKKAKVNVRSVLSFTEEDKVGTIQPHDNALMVTLRIGGYDVKRVMVDQGSGAEIMYHNLYKGLNLRPEDLTPYSSPLVSFNGKVVVPKSQIRLPIQAGSEVVEVDFIVMDVYSPYTAIVARSWLHALGAVSSTLHQKKKFFQIGAQLPTPEKEKLIKFLRRNIDVFTWNAYKALGMDPSFICHHLNVNPSATPKRQPPQCSSKDHTDTVRDKVMKLRQAGAINEVFYLEWLANTVVVKKKNGKWLMCVDFTDLNRACPKDPFPMPKIDQLVDATIDHHRISFLNAF